MTEHTDNLTHPLEKIAHQPEKKVDNNDTEEKLASAPSNVKSSHESVPAPPRLTPALVQEPAILVDQKLRVAWQNQAAKSKIWHDAGAVNNGNPKPGILGLLFDAHFKRRVENWRSWVRFFIQQTFHMVSRDALEQAIQGCDEGQKEMLKEIIKQAPPDEERQLYSGSMRQLLSDGLIADFWVVATQFSEGRYLAFKPSAADSKALAARGSAEIEHRFERLRRLDCPSSLPIYTLAARLGSARTLRTEMLADEYSQLLSRLYRQAITCIEKFGGLFHKLAESAFIVCFMPDPQHESLPQQVIDCAFELKRQMVDLAREWKIRKGWLHDLALDIGLHWNEEPISALSTSTGDQLATFGDSQSVAVALSRLARDGQIWSTKAFINQIPPQEQKKLRFGIFRKGHPHKVLINKSFTRLKDFASIDRVPKETLTGELGAIAATQIFDRQA